MIAITASTCRCGTGCSAPILAEPEAGHQGMTIGLTPYQSEAPTRFGWSLRLPFWRQQQRND